MPSNNPVLRPPRITLAEDESIEATEEVSYSLDPTGEVPATEHPSHAPPPTPSTPYQPFAPPPGRAFYSHLALTVAQAHDAIAQLDAIGHLSPRYGPTLLANLSRTYEQLIGCALEVNP